MYLFRNMKKIVFITILSLLIGSLQAQDKETIPGNNNWRIEVATLLSSDPDLLGTSFYTEYYKYVSSRFKLAIGIGSQNFNAEYRGEFNYGDILNYDADALMVGISCYYDIIKTKRFNFELGLGAFVKKWDETYVIVRMYPDWSSGDKIWIASSTVDNSRRHTSFTPSISLGSQYCISEYISVNLKGFIQAGVENNSRSVAGIAAGITVKWNNK